MSEKPDVTDQHPLCRHLRSSGMYLHDSLDPFEESEEVPGSGDGNFWCINTMQQFGPDNEEVNRKSCNPSRECFEEL